jgi:hypothetical protein
MSISEIRIGQYRFSKNLGNGSFGKVKSKCILCILRYCSGVPRANRAQGGHQDPKQEEDPPVWRFRESKKGAQDSQEI